MFRDDTVGMFTALFVALQMALTVGAFVALRYQRIARSVGLAALVVLGLLPLTYLAGAIDWAPLGRAAYLSFVFVGAAVAALAAWVAGRRDPVVSVGWMLAPVVGVIATNVVLTDSVLQFSTVFGDSPIVGAGNYADNRACAVSGEIECNLSTDALTGAPADAVPVDVQAQQFTWKFSLPGSGEKYGKTSDIKFPEKSVHIQELQPVVFNLTSRDVIHSLFIPQLRVKHDVVPGHQNRVAEPFRLGLADRVDRHELPEPQNLLQKVDPALLLERLLESA